MNWVTTNLRLPEDLYIDLKLKAAHERKSVAAVIREKLAHHSKQKNSQDIREMFVELGNKIAKEDKKLNLTKNLIEMRYEQ